MAGLVAPNVSSPPSHYSMSVSPAGKCYRMVFDSHTKVVRQLEEDTGFLSTPHSLFVSDLTDGSGGSVTSAVGQSQCLDYITANGLKIVLQGRMTPPFPWSNRFKKRG